MTRPPDDSIDPYEGRLARRVGSFSDQAVVPIDPVAIAASSSAAARRRTFAGRLFGANPAAGRLALIGAGALLVAALGVAIGAGGKGLFGPSSTATASPSSALEGVPGVACAVTALAAVIHGWDGAAGHRIAAVEIRNDSVSACSVLTVLQVALVDATGRVLITSAAPAGVQPGLSLPAGASGTTLVQAGNYCGPAPDEPVALVFTFPDGSQLRTTDAEDATGDGVPPCSGTNGPRDDIQMQPFQRQ